MSRTDIAFTNSATPHWRVHDFALLFLLLVTLLAGVTTHASAQTAKESPLLPRLAILLNYKAGGPTSEALVDALSGKTPGPASAQLVQKFQNPKAAKLLIADRLPGSIRQTLKDDDPSEILQRYVVLEFASWEAARAAKATLQKDASVLYVKESEEASFLAVPADPYYAYNATSNRDYQWSLNDAMWLQPAWDVVRGTAYLVLLDNGIQTRPAVHEDLTQAFRRFNFNVAGGEDVDEHPELTQDDGTGNQGAAGHGTHVAGIMAGATSQTSVPAGYPNPSPAVGGAGVCWYCSLMVAKVSRRGPGNQVTIDSVVDVPAALNWAVNAGAQVVNMSLGGADHNCPASPFDAFCAALSVAASRQVVVVAAAGNSDQFNGSGHVGDGLGAVLDFPASNANTIAVGATQAYAGGIVGREYIWTEENPRRGFFGSSTGPGMESRGILAPGRAILSTFYEGRNWNIFTRCGVMSEFLGLPIVDGHTTDYGPGTNRGPKYGLCTGTSMAAPHISGVVGLMRTVNPLLGATDIRTRLLSTGYNAATPNTIRGFGIANASGAVNSVLATTNRLTPLFSAYSSVAADHFYTVVPQMARAAVAAWLLPYATGSTAYTPYGTSVSEYPGFADPQFVNYTTPKAQVWVFTTHANPKVPSAELMPLYRLSWKCGDPGTSTCASNPYHVSHFYTTNLSEAQSYISSLSYQFDGIEGYVYPTSQAKPTGTTSLLRAYNPARDDYALFPEQEQSNMATQGYSSSLSSLGYVYVNSGSRPSY